MHIIVRSWPCTSQWVRTKLLLPHTLSLTARRIMFRWHYHKIIYYNIDFQHKTIPFYLHSHCFTDIIDYKLPIAPIVAALLQRWVQILSACQYYLKFCSTGDIGNADGLSQLPLSRIRPNDSDVWLFNISQIEASPTTKHEICIATIKNLLLR